MHKYLLTLSLLCSNFLLSQSSPYQCAEIKSPAERLACYDNLFARPDKQINIKKPIIKPNNNPSTEKEKRLSFDQINKLKSGKQKDKSNEAIVNNSNFGLQKLPEDIKNNNYLLTSIVRNTKTKNNKIIFTMDNGQRWIADSSYRSRNLFKPQTRIKIEPASISGFQMIAIEKNQKVRIKRLK